jgi:hypothetical protein
LRAKAKPLPKVLTVSDPAIFLEFVLQDLARNAEDFCGSGTVVFDLSQGGVDQQATLSLLLGPRIQFASHKTKKPLEFFRRLFC